MNVSNNKRLAVNTTLLYIRMIFVMLVTLYIVRFLLNQLGIVDYGIFNVITSITLFMGIISSSMTSAAQRYFSYALGQNDILQYRKTFSMLVFIFLIFGIIGVGILETVGIWFVKNHMVIPENRISSGVILLHFTIGTFFVNLLAIPFTSSIISYEKMDVYAYISIIEILLKLFIVFLLRYIEFDKLIWVGAMYLCLAFLHTSTYIIYCFRYIGGCKFILNKDVTLLKSLLSFMGWNLFGTTAATMNVQGQTLLLNIFYGPLVNAAKAVADQVNSAVSAFVTNFYLALNPQIIKSFAKDDISYTRLLVINASKYSVYFLMIISLPLICNMRSILELWLGAKEITDEMELFCKIILLIAFTNALEGPLTQVVRATGNIRSYQVKIGLQTLLYIPICYVVLSIGVPAFYSMIILLLINIVVLISRILISGKIIQLSIVDYSKLVLFPCMLSSSFISLFLYAYYKIANETIFDVFLINIIVTVIVVFSVIFLLGINKKERLYIIDIIRNKFLLCLRK